MTDLLDDPLAIDLDAPADMKKPKLCAEDGCDTYFESAVQGGHFRKYCDLHQPPPKSKAGGKKRPARAPRSVTVNLNTSRTSKKDGEIAQVRDRALQLANLLAAVLVVSGQPEDGGDVATHAPALADALAAVAEHEAWLRKIAAGGETSARAMAWLQLSIVMVGLLTPILVRHGVLKGRLADAARQAGIVGSSVIGSPPPGPSQTDFEAEKAFYEKEYSDSETAGDASPF